MADNGTQGLKPVETPFKGVRGTIGMLEEGVERLVGSDSLE
jgi:hypothetical protein